ncbi:MULTISPECIES: sigma-54 interaction domain-containing protein [unclassified Clostridioides]|uniref:sigma-54 interaction domain-containing protein n=1 Tax=unclassified Clostridioides TaxID=2635829 RepID=UPI001D0FC817|nr:sigma 54-interacting transcriptional regulator [Clostridioides sp. ZZV14-6150]MCC0661539.1 sigma 54-interacting transcriptional regulator [Clostridioides sp. ZZV14-6154]MCC0668901.1 sigma 54-interacting transcriptional regulator [Clostridioides sp. ZZV14-6153]MCC0718284.1 sigma 54-interacting transcriptional regulator [Clostridioides sp. ZZV14-6105]MCC0721621.1 sigma 54-interacting transcriptional regulator [Clostridioides sp. ZZV14-6104]MCC0727697.1 sigma 54-interacting transcriptional reg
MKTIAVVTDGLSKLECFLNKNLKLIFKDKVKIKNYYLNRITEEELIKDDIILVMIDDRVLKIKKYVKDVSKIITINRSIKQRDIYKLFSLPEGIDVLVVNDNNHTVLETISNLYNIGINHLNFIPYNPNEEYRHIKIAITPGERELVPEYIKEVIDLGHRYIDSSTFIQIIAKLKLDDKEITERLIKYTDEVISLYSGINTKYKELTIKADELNSIINLSNLGMAMISEKENIIICNDSLSDTLDIQNDIIGKNIDELENENIKKIFRLSKAHDEVIKFNNKYLNVNKYNIESFGRVTGYYFCIQEITYIRKLEQNLSKKLREKGQVARYTFDDIKTVSVKMERTKELGMKIAESDYTVLITGESGTGKELMAQSIHNASPRHSQPFIAINCAAMPENLLESELFGYEEGAFTGALRGGKKGLFEQANNGTIFLDEIGDMPIYLQSKLLRVLQENQVMRVGGENVIDTDVRVIAATNKNLLEMIKKDRFRADLYYRINVLPINIPPLRERKEDIEVMLKYFMKRKREISQDVQDIINAYEWPGNIRELKNTAMYINIMSSEHVILINDLPHNLLNITEDYSKEISTLKDRTSIEKVRLVMECLKNANNLNKNIGRNGIVNSINELGYNITEGEVRGILNILKELDLIICESGRKGSELNRRGKNILNSI